MGELRTTTHPRISTKNADGNENGFLVPIYNMTEEFGSRSKRPEQVYLTVASPGETKGPHLHMRRWGYFTCVKGNIRVIVRIDGKYEEYFSGEEHDFATIEVPAGIPAALQNISSEDAYILNMPCPAWQPDDQDEHEVAFPDCGWLH